MEKECSVTSRSRAIYIPTKVRGDSGPGPLADSKSNGMVHNPRDREVSHKMGGGQRKFTKKNACWTINFPTTVEQETNSSSDKIQK